MVNQNSVEVNARGLNSAIKAHVLSDEQMKDIGFTDNGTDYWYFNKSLEDSISLSVAIRKDGSDFTIDVWDDGFLQIYDYQYLLEKNPKFEFALLIQEKVEHYMEYLQNAGVLEGHKFGEYI